MHRPRVLFIATNPELIGGAEQCLVDLVSEMRSSAWEPLVVVPDEGSLAEALRALGVTVEVVDLGVLRHRAEARSPILALRLLTAVRASIAIRRLIRRHDVAVVHTNAAGAIAGAIAARRTRTPHVWHLREILSGPAWPPLRKAMLGLSARVICISDCVADHLTGGAARGETVVVLRDGIDLALFAPPDPRSPSDEVLMLGRIHPDKGHKEFIRAAAAVMPRVPDATFTLVGGCNPAYEDLRRELVDMISELGLDGRVTMRPAISRGAAADALRAAAVAVVPSTWVEPGGLVVLEGMACGTPVVASDRGGPAEVITDGKDGFLVAPADTARFAGILADLLADPDLRARVGRHSRERIVAAFGLDSQVAALTAIYDELVR